MCVYAGDHIRFEAKSAGKAMAWVESIRQAIHEEEKRERQRVSAVYVYYLDACVCVCVCVLV